MKYLVVVAHPDDEILGFGASAVELAAKGHEVDVCILSMNCDTRDDLYKVNETHKMLGISNCYSYNFKCLAFKDENHWEIVKAIENAIRKSKPDVVVTHHPADLHNDHYITSICCQEAVRLPQRQLDYKKPIVDFWYMMVNSSTDWALNHAWNKFSPNTFVPVSEDAVDKKVMSLRIYDEVVREHPYPRSEENIKAQCTVYGSLIGSKFAEGFECVFRRVDAL